MDGEKIYMAVDLKSFFASVECVERNLNPLTTNLVVADLSRTEKTICLAVTPSLKAHGISGRARLFEVVQRVEEINVRRRANAPDGVLQGSSVYAEELERDKSLELSYITAEPRMSKYIEYSNRVFEVYLQFFSPEDVHAYSIDEVFIDATTYIKEHGCTPEELAMEVVLAVLHRTGITATAGIGPNLFLCKVAMDVQAKKIPPDKNGVRIARLTEESFRSQLWNHRPITDFWQIGPGTAEKLEKYGMLTLRDVVKCAEGRPEEFYNRELLYRLFGVNAEVLIDHARGLEPCTVSQLKNYVPKSSSLNQGQVLKEPYCFEDAETVLREMAESLSLELLAKGFCTDMVTLVVGYDSSASYLAEQSSLVRDHYGRTAPRSDRGTSHLPYPTSLTSLITGALCAVFERVVSPAYPIRRINISAENLSREEQAPEKQEEWQQLSLESVLIPGEKTPEQTARQEREKIRQTAVLEIKEKYGGNAILKGTSFRKGATAQERNGQIGGHKS